MSPGKLVVLEGLDGSGKATQTRILCGELRNLGRRVCRISCPDYTQPSSALAKMYLGGEFGSRPLDVNAYAASSFFAVDRYASYQKFWKSRYLKGQIVVADRYTTSNAVYQLGKLPKSQWNAYLEWLEEYEYLQLELPRPDLVVYLDMPVEISQKFMDFRSKSTGIKKDLHEKNIIFLKNCREAALYTAKKCAWKFVRCSSEDGVPRSVDDIHSEILKLVHENLF